MSQNHLRAIESQPRFPALRSEKIEIRIFYTINRIKTVFQTIFQAKLKPRFQISNWIVPPEYRRVAPEGRHRGPGRAPRVALPHRLPGVRRGREQLWQPHLRSTKSEPLNSNTYVWGQISFLNRMPFALSQSQNFLIWTLEVSEWTS